VKLTWWATAAGFAALVGICTGAAPAQAKAVCSDDSGTNYSFNTAPPAGLNGFVCHVENMPAPPPSAAEVAGSARAALALPLPAPAPAPTFASKLVLAGPAKGGMSWAANAAAPRPLESQYLDSMIVGMAHKYGHDANLLKAIIHVESRFNPNAVSAKGAIGLMQVMPATGLRVGISTPGTALFDPALNVQAGARYLRILMDMFADRPDLAVAAYNAGEGAVLRHKRCIPPYPETQAYVRDVMAQYKRYAAL
jgi:soluble lytic murein transglycosylase-like protein